MEPTSSKKSIFEVMTHDGHNHIVTPIPLIDRGTSKLRVLFCIILQDAFLFLFLDNLYQNMT